MDLNRSSEKWRNLSKKNNFFLYSIGIFAIVGVLVCFIGYATNTLPMYTPITENDAFLYQWMTEKIVENSTLPPRDTHRWLPIGRDNGQLLPLYSYAIAYTHKTLAWFFPAL